jgi:hypothetical protein
MSDDLETKSQQLLKWLEEHGGPVELQVASAFQRAGFAVSQGVHWLDPESSKLRECDLLAFRQRNIGVEGTHFAVATTFLVECKRSQYPWVAFVANDDDRFAKNEPYTVFSWVVDDLARELVLPDVAQLAKGRPSIYSDGPSAYSLVEARLGSAAQKNETNRAFNAVQQVLDATEARYAQVTKAKEKSRCHFTFPILVFDGFLYRYSLGTSGPELQQVPETTLFLRDRTLGSGIARVQVVTLRALEEFLARAKAQEGWIGDLAYKVVERRTEAKGAARGV